MRAGNWVICLAVATCLVACRSGGTITIDRPQVFSRERLVQERVDETTWLTTQLNDQSVKGSELEGASVFREFASVAASIGAGKGSSVAAPTTLDLTEDAAAQAKLPGAAPKTGLIVAPGQPTTATDGQLPAIGVSPIDRFRGMAEYRAEIRTRLHDFALDDAHDLHGRTLYTFKFDVTLNPAGDNDRLADVKFDVAMPKSEGLSSDAIGRWVASVDARLNEEAWALYTRATRAQLSTSDLAEISRRTTEVVAAAHGNRPTLTALDLTGLSATLDRRLGRGKSERVVEAITTTAPSSDDVIADIAAYGALDAFDVVAQANAKAKQDGSPLVATQNALSMAKAIARLVVQRYDALGSVLALKPLEKPDTSGGLFIDVARKVDDEQIRAKIAGSTTGDLYVLAVEPKELVQNISDFAAKARLQAFAANLAATLPTQALGPIDVAALMESADLKETTVQAVLRQPLAVGYMSGDTRFGWLFGPQFRVEDGDATFEHFPRSRPVMVTVAVPAWCTRLRFDANYHWNSQAWNPVTSWLGIPIDFDFIGVGARRDAFRDGVNERGGGVFVDLPADPEAITFALLATSGDARPAPFLVSAGAEGVDGAALQFRAQSTARMVIRGSDLWRSPQVFLGEVKATTVQVLSDMKGLYVEWPAFDPGVGIGGVLTPLDLRVVTSWGTATVRSAAVLVPASVGPGAVSMTLVSLRAVGGETLKVKVSKNVPVTPAQQWRVKLAVTPIQSADCSLVGVDSSSSNTEHVLTFSVPTITLQGSARVAVLAATVVPPAALASPFPLGDVGYFVDAKADAGSELKPRTLTFTPAGPGKKATLEGAIAIGISNVAAFAKVHTWLPRDTGEIDGLALRLDTGSAADAFVSVPLTSKAKSQLSSDGSGQVLVALAKVEVDDAVAAVIAAWKLAGKTEVNGTLTKGTDTVPLYCGKVGLN